MCNVANARICKYCLASARIYWNPRVEHPLAPLACGAWGTRPWAPQHAIPPPRRISNGQKRRDADVNGASVKTNRSWRTQATAPPRLSGCTVEEPWGNRIATNYSPPSSRIILIVYRSLREALATRDANPEIPTSGYALKMPRVSWYSSFLFILFYYWNNNSDLFYERNALLL